MAEEAETLAAAAESGAEHGAEYAADAAHGAEAAVGMPQLDFATFPNQIFWLVVALVAIYLILNRVALPRISSVLAVRQGTITNHIAAAEDLKRQAAEAEAAYEKALADARAKAQEIAAETRAKIQAQLDDELEKADAQIAEKTAESQTRIAEIEAQSREVIEQVARETTGEIVAALGGTADAAAVEKAVTDRLRGDA